MKIMIVDDDEIALELLANTLTNANYCIGSCVLRLTRLRPE